MYMRFPLVIAALILSAPSLWAQAPPPGAGAPPPGPPPAGQAPAGPPPAGQAPAPAAGAASGTPSTLPPGRVFTAERGLIFNAIRADKVADFEMVLDKLRSALETSKDPVRKQQGWGWKILKASEPGPNGSVLYVFMIDPVVKGADYGVARILSEAYPTEITELYKMYSTAFAAGGQTMLNLAPVGAQPDPTRVPGTPAAAPTPAATTAPAPTAPR